MQTSGNILEPAMPRWQKCHRRFQMASWALVAFGKEMSGIQSRLGAVFKVPSSSLGSELIRGLHEAEAGTLRAILWALGAFCGADRTRAG